jgi:hypothetical protein
MTLYAFKLVDRNLYVWPEANIVDPFGSYLRDDAILRKKRNVFLAAMKHVEENQIASATACRIIKSDNCSIRDGQLYRRVHVFLVMEEKEASLFRIFFPELKWEKWTKTRLNNVKKPKPSNFEFASWYATMRAKKTLASAKQTPAQ